MSNPYHNKDSNPNTHIGKESTMPKKAEELEEKGVKAEPKAKFKETQNPSETVKPLKQQKGAE